jgi:hypothetical protein
VGASASARERRQHAADRPHGAPCDQRGVHARQGEADVQPC